MHDHDEQLVIGFDLDGVIMDHTQNKIRIASRYGIKLSLEETPSEIMWSRVPSEIQQEFREQMYDDTDEALSVPLMAGAFDGLMRLKELNVRYFLISRRKKPIHALHLIERRGLWGSAFTPENTFFVEGLADKDPVAARLGVTHFIDDESRVLRLMPSVEHRVLFGSQDPVLDDMEFLRVKTWSELEQLLGISNR